VTWFSGENFDSPNAIETPRFPPPMMCTFMLVMVFLSPPEASEPLQKRRSCKGKVLVV
jgi:hypothetical protein